MTTVLHGHDQSGTTANRPDNADVGQTYFDTDIGELISWDGSAWKIVSGYVPLKRSLVALTLANLQALAATPIEVIPAVADKIHVVAFWRFRLIFNDTAIDDAAADGDLILEYDGEATIDTMEADGLVDAGANTQGISGNLTELIDAEADLTNKAVQISNDGDEFTIAGGGDSTAEVEVFYYELDAEPS